MSRQVVVADKQTGEVKGEACQGCIEHSKTIGKLAKKIRELEADEQERLGLAADSATILDILKHHKRLFPGTRIIRGKAAWKAVRARLADVDAETGRPMFTPLALKAAAMGLKLERAGSRSDWSHGALWLYEDGEKVLKYLGRAVTFERETGSSAMELVDELGERGLAFLASRCTCGLLRISHLMGDAGLCPFEESLEYRVAAEAARRDRLNGASA